VTRLPAGARAGSFSRDTTCSQSHSRQRVASRRPTHDDGGRVPSLRACRVQHAPRAEPQQRLVSRHPRREAAGALPTRPCEPARVGERAAGHAGRRRADGAGAYRRQDVVARHPDVRPLQDLRIRSVALEGAAPAQVAAQPLVGARHVAHRHRDVDGVGEHVPPTRVTARSAGVRRRRQAHAGRSRREHADRGRLRRVAHAVHPTRGCRVGEQPGHPVEERPQDDLGRTLRPSELPHARRRARPRQGRRDVHEARRGRPAARITTGARCHAETPGGRGGVGCVWAGNFDGWRQLRHEVLGF
jgi:hypothetical protein